MRSLARRGVAVRMLACLAGLLAATVAEAQVATQRIAAVVNDDVITTQDLIDRINLGIATSGLPNDDATRQRLAPQVLRGFIDEKLQLQEAQRLGTEVTEIDSSASTLTLASGERQGYDRLLLATGSEPRRLDVPGADLDGDPAGGACPRGPVHSDAVPSRPEAPAGDTRVRVLLGAGDARRHLRSH